MSNVPALIPILSNQDIIASEVSSNFDVIVAAINSQAVNSDNYGVGSILATHLASGCVITAKILDAQVTEAKLLHTQASSGVKALRLGPDSGGGEGVRQAVVTHSFSVTANSQTITFGGTWGNAQRGDPAFQATPEPTGVAIVLGGTDAHIHAYYQEINSNTYKIFCSVVQSTTDTGTDANCVIYATAQGQV